MKCWVEEEKSLKFRAFQRKRVRTKNLAYEGPAPGGVRVQGCSGPVVSGPVVQWSPARWSRSGGVPGPGPGERLRPRPGLGRVRVQGDPGLGPEGSRGPGGSGQGEGPGGGKGEERGGERRRRGRRRSGEGRVVQGEGGSGGTRGGRSRLSVWSCLCVCCHTRVQVYCVYTCFACLGAVCVSSFQSRNTPR